MTYFGLVGLCLGVLGLVRVRTYRSPIGRAAIGLVVVGLLLALGEFSVVYHWLHDHVWLIARLANPGRAIVLVHVGWVVLAAFGTEWLLRRCRHWERWAGLGLILAVSIELLWWGWGVNPRQNLSVWETPRVAAHVPARQDAPRIFTHTTLELSGRGTFVPEVGPAVTRTSVLQQTIVPQHDEWKGVDVELTWNGQVPTSGQVSLVVLEEDREVRRAAINGEAIDETPIIFSFDPFERAKGRRFTLQLFSSYDLPNAPYIFIRPHYGEGDFNPTGELSVCRLGECNPLTAAGWTRPADAGLHLRYRDRSIWIERELMLPMFGEAAGKFMVRPHLSLQLGTVDAYLRELGLRADYDSSRWVTERDLYDRFSIGTVVAGYPEHRGLVGVPGLTPIARELAGERELAVYRNEQAYPRIEFVQELVPVQDAEMARTALLAGIERHAIVVEGLAEDEIITEVGRSPGRLIVEVDEPTRFHGRVESEGVQFLVMRDVLYSAWKAWIDDQAVSLYRVDGVFRGVLIPAGVHEVRVELISPAWRWGAGLSAGAWVVSLAGLGIIYRNKLRRVSRP